MKMWLLLLVGFALVQAQTTLPGNAVVTIRTDLECKLKIDGKPQGVIRTTEPVRIVLSTGEHDLEAVPMEKTPVAKWQDTLDFSDGVERSIEVTLLDATRRAVIQNRGYWIDTITKMMWAASDNGSGVSLTQARRYCDELSLAGFKDWRLPAIDELQTIVGGRPDAQGYRILTPLKLTGWAWSSTQGREPGEGWALDFGDGARASVVAGDSGLNRALCVVKLQRFCK